MGRDIYEMRSQRRHLCSGSSQEESARRDSGVVVGTGDCLRLSRERGVAVSETVSEERDGLHRAPGMSICSERRKRVHSNPGMRKDGAKTDKTTIFPTEPRDVLGAA
ncbi:hypothetical protein NDU88_007930 [Pleurodeles waltl]|uniref:Uncharacterized protein n=1 Tax=Pleurodeles waltl TaxID=8319 RepID=A0AAV7U156_PLEWA|nr:hypothetical protein NDU88_007930 [Pleurodeles waltl]